MLLESVEPMVRSRSELRPADRCDSCGAQAYVAAVVDGTELLYCGHHANRFESGLRKVASSFYDERHKLAELSKRR